MNYQSITELTRSLGKESTHGSVCAQYTQRTDKMTRQGRPYLEVCFADTQDSLSFKVWDNSPRHAELLSLPLGSCVELTADWRNSDYGLEVSELSLRPLNPDEVAVLLAGSPELRERQQQAWERIDELVASIHDPRLATLCREFLSRNEARFRRAAAARNVHHARRGGLVEHTAAVMRLGASLCDCYPELNRDLVLAGALFHDSGKMWENNYEEQGLNSPYSTVGELMGHITLSIELVNKLWNGMMTPERREEWKDLHPASEQVRLHLLHLIAAHHGTLEFGSPVVPKTPEAFALHAADDTDAKLEIFRNAYATAPALSEQVLQRRFPMEGNPVLPLPPFGD